MTKKLSYSESGKLGWIASKEKRDFKYLSIRNNYETNPKKCKHCNKIIDWNHRRNDFCNSSCFAIHTNCGKITKRSHICKECGKYISYNRKWCSKKCQRVYEFKYNREHNYPIGKSAIRGYLLITREHKCEQCNLSKWFNNLIILEVHHKDGNHNNNSEENLELLCPNCHSLTDNYKSKNKGNGRPHRRKPVERIELPTSEFPD